MTEMEANIENTGEEKNVANPIPDDRIVYMEGFYYDSLSEEIKQRITGISYPVAESKASEMEMEVFNTLGDDVVPAVTYDDLCYLSVLYYDFNGEVQSGELICNKKIADDLAEIFYELYLNEYQIEKMILVDEYNADDTASITDNNTSCFNYRVVDGTTTLSKHALGCAIDINPFYNPYIVFNKDGSGETYISPPGSEIYADRSKDFPYKIDENDLCYKLFKAHGFTWGGDWNSCKDYQHFQKVVE
ncbi:MAG: M15 family metallopeptidase [Lachnospiraceae bacterium]|nr:M15 family metallopeptidase [Lachnospiraceae bacterium]